MDDGTTGGTAAAECDSHPECGSDMICDAGRCTDPYVVHGYGHIYDYSNQFGSLWSSEASSE